MAVAALLVPVIYNGLVTDRFGVTTSTGAHMYNRVVTEQGLLDRDGPATRELVSRVGDRPLQGLSHQDTRALMSELDDGEAMDLMGDAAREGMLSQPLQFELFSIRMAIREYAPTPSLEPWPSAVATTPRLESVVPTRFHGGSVLWWARLDHEWSALWPWLLWLPLAGLLALPLLRERLLFLALLALPLGYIFVNAHIEFFLPRYSAAVMPFLLMLAPAPVPAIKRAVVRAAVVLRRGRRASSLL